MKLTACHLFRRELNAGHGDCNIRRHCWRNETIPNGGKATIKFSKNPAGEAKRLVPPELLPFVTAEAGPAPLAVRNAVRAKLTGQLAAAGLKAALGVEAEQGRLNLQSEQLPEIGAASRAGMFNGG
jgi:hypothetical protein